jgi:hypothetical protein
VTNTLAAPEFGLVEKSVPANWIALVMDAKKLPK